MVNLINYNDYKIYSKDFSERAPLFLANNKKKKDKEKIVNSQYKLNNEFDKNWS